MLSRSVPLLRQQTAWRALLHPLPMKARRMQWLKRDQVELNEAILRKPYYTIKQHSTKERDEHLRQTSLVIPSATGPHVAGEPTSSSLSSRLRPRYPESWETVPPHQPSKAM